LARKSGTYSRGSQAAPGRYQAAGGRTEITVDESGFLEPPVIEQLIAAAADRGRLRAALLGPKAAWLDPRPGADPDSVIDGPPPPAAGRLDALGIRVGRHTEIDDRLLIHRIDHGESIPEIDDLFVVSA
jgi:hypothetical protein